MLYLSFTYFTTNDQLLIEPSIFCSFSLQHFRTALLLLADRSTPSTPTNIQKNKKGQLRAVRHKRKQCTKRELTATVTRTQETPITKLSLKRNDYREFYIIIKEKRQLQV